MNITKYIESDVNKLIEIWYEGSITAHNFINKDYWKTQQEDMKEKYLPMSETYVIRNEKEVVGFASMVDDYLAALFIDVHHQGHGYGKRLLNFVKEHSNTIQLKVYKKNKNAVNFYLKNGFLISEELIDEPTAEEELLMKWKKV
ncbi:putative acetyltransferase [Gracilibacillus halotolerans]|uniref:Putative acetyltransferase n=1 Tax=Gracilibacillus halotolerans TaxID=74386 RepID=A0A841RIZ7_9BACI|nr:N-acetyltransferase [Gracilibacillus halotolerans]MBB6514210.1 putative acetyltransferase [Gracilibacillus halotolerans]